MIRVYVAGAYSADNVIGILGNMRRGLQLSYYVLKAGFAPFAPWLDYLFAFLGPVSLQEYYEYSMAWLEGSQAILTVKENLSTSAGAQKELERAKELGIPIFYSIHELKEWAAENGQIK